MNERVSDLEELIDTPQANDEIVIVDKSDLSLNVDGKVKRIKYDLLKSSIKASDAITASVSISFGVIGANSTKEIAFPVENISNGDWVASSPLSQLPSGISIALTYVDTGNNTIIRLSNCTTSSIDIGSVDFIINKIVTSPIQQVAPVFNWESDSSLVLNLDSRSLIYSDAGTTPVANGEEVRQWNNVVVGQDISFFEQTASNKPIYRTGGQNSLPYLEFNDASDLFMTSDANFSYTEGSVFIVAEVEGSFPSGQVGILGFSNLDGSLLGIRNGFYHSSESSGSSSLIGVSGTSGKSRKAFNDSGRPVSISAAWGSNKNWVVRENYAELGRSLNTASSVSFGTPDKLNLGNWRYAFNTNQARFTGKIYKVLFYNRYLTDQEMESVNNALAGIYNHHPLDQWFKDLEGGTQRGVARLGYTALNQLPTRILNVVAGQSNALTTSSDNPAQADSPVVSNVNLINANYVGEIAGVRTRIDSNTIETLNIPVNLDGSSSDPAEPAWQIGGGILWNLNNTSNNGHDLLLVASGGTSLAGDWSPTGNYLFDDVVQNINEMYDSAGETDATIYTGLNFIWLQGEADGLNEAFSLAYQANENNFIDEIKLNIPSNDFDFISVTAFGQPFAGNVNAAKTANSARDDYTLVTGVTSGTELHDGVHHTAQFAVTLSESIANTLLNLN